MSQTFTRKNLPLAVMLASGLFASNAMAQLEEVIVTAQKRVATLQETPIAMSAFNAEAIQNMGLIDAKDIGMASPYLQMPAYPTSSNNLAMFSRSLRLWRLMVTRTATGKPDSFNNRSPLIALSKEWGRL